MAADSSMVALLSPWTVSDNEGSTFTNEMYQAYWDISKSRLDSENPGFPPELYDYCHTLLICHLRKVREGKLEVTSENIGSSDHAYEKRVGVTTYMLEYKQILADFRVNSVSSGGITSRGVERDDIWMDSVSIDKASKSPSQGGWI